MPTENTSNRRLAAILFADIVGYTALMQKGEFKAMSILNRFTEVSKDKVSQYNGDIIKTYGDGSLILFDSTVDAVQCAHDMQVAFRLGVQVPLRIGIHVGEVIKKDNDIFGNGVNIASRVESMGIAGSVLMSADAQKRIKNQESLTTRSLGSFEFKNVEEPIEVFALANDGFTIPDKAMMEGKFKSPPTEKNSKSKWWPLVMVLFLAYPLYYFITQNSKVEASDLNEKSIAVLPFTDLSPEKDQEYFSIGMMDEILNHLVKIEDLQVSSRTSSMQYLKTTTSISEISQRLGAANVLEGSVRKAGDQIRITVQLINGLTDKHLWSETYDREFKDIFSIQSDVAQRVARTLEAEIYSGVKARIEEVPTTNMDAYDLWLRTYDLDPNPQKADLLHEIIAMDSTFASAYALLANVWLNKGGFAGGSSREEILPEANKYLDKAFELDPNNALAYKNKAQLLLWYEWDFKNAEIQWERFIQLSPSSPNSNIIDFYSSAGMFKEAKEWAERIYIAYKKEGGGWIRRGLPYALSGDFEKSNEYYGYVVDNFTHWYGQSEAARGFLYAREYQKSIETLQRSFKNAEDENELRFPRNLAVLSMAHFHLGDNEKANQLLDELLEYCDKGSSGSPAFYTAMVYAQMGEVNEAFKWLDQAYESHELEMYWLKVEPPFKPLHSDPRWEEMLIKVGFDVEIKG